MIITKIYRNVLIAEIALLGIFIFFGNKCGNVCHYYNPILHPFGERPIPFSELRACPLICVYEPAWPFWVTIDILIFTILSYPIIRRLRAKNESFRIIHILTALGIVFIAFAVIYSGLLTEFGI